MKEMDDMKKKEKMEKRKASLADAGLSEEEVEESLANFDALEDEAFQAIVALMKEKDDKKKEAEAAMPPALKEALEKKKKDKEADASPGAGGKPAPSKKPVMAEEEAEADVTPELLEDVETSEATLVEATPEVDEVESTRASISNWLETNVLNKKS